MLLNSSRRMAGYLKMNVSNLDSGRCTRRQVEIDSSSVLPAYVHLDTHTFKMYLYNLGHVNDR